MKRLIILILLVFPIISIAQVAVKRIDLTNQKSLLSTVNFKNLKKFTLKIKIDTNSLLREDIEESRLGLPYRFGVGHLVDIGLEQGRWTETSQGRIWHLEINSPNAYSLNFIFDQYNLSQGSELMIFNRKGNMQMGPFTSDLNNKFHYVPTDLIEGDDVIITLFEPKAVKGSSKLHISKIVHGYKNTFNDSYANAGYGQSSPCEINTNCPQGNDWINETNGISLIILGNGERLCSGSLLNNACQDLKPYLLTAFHCVDIDTPDGLLSDSEKNAVGEWIFRFKYKSRTCSGGEGNDYISFNGSVFKAAYQASDFALFELLKIPFANTQLYYNGWSRNTSPPLSTTMLHHPKGDVMKISSDNTGSTSNPLPINFYLDQNHSYIAPANSHWATIMTSGGAEPGSSGSPQFNQDHLVVGQLHGGSGTCPGDNNFRQYFGRFDLSWNGGGTPDSRLKDWLDPTNTNITSVNGFMMPLISGPPYICSMESFQISGLPIGTTISSWSVTPPFSISGSGNSTIVYSNNTSGMEGILTANYNSYCGSNVKLTLPIHAGNPYWRNAVITGDNNPICVNGSAIYTVPTYQYSQNNEYRWSISPLDPSDYQMEYQGWNTNTIYVYKPGNYILQVNTQGPCGTEEYTYTFIEVIDCNNLKSSETYTLYPNPANNQITVNCTLSNSNLTSKRKKEGFSYEVKLFDNKGRILANGQTALDEYNLTLDTSGIPDGTYYVHIYSKKGTIKKQVIIKH